jgi:hypothetical protein
MMARKEEVERGELGTDTFSSFLCRYLSTCIE